MSVLQLVGTKMLPGNLDTKLLHSEEANFIV